MSVIYSLVLLAADTVESTPLSWAYYADRYGIPTVVLAALLFMILRAGRYLAVEVVTPVTKRHLEFVNSIDDCTSRLTACAEGIDKRTERIEDAQSKHIEICRVSNPPTIPWQAAKG